MCLRLESNLYGWDLELEARICASMLGSVSVSVYYYLHCWGLSLQDGWGLAWDRGVKKHGEYGGGEHEHASKIGQKKA